MAARRAEVLSLRREGKRSYLLAQAPDGPLFARYSVDPADVAVFAHEDEVRRLVGVEGPLRAPPVLDRGRGWLLEAAIEAEPFRGRGAVETAVAAVERLGSLDLPEAPVLRRPLATVRRRLRIAASPVPRQDLLAARRTLRETPLALVTGHGDFYTGNVLLGLDAAWVVDWECAGRWPLGYDLMRLWSTLDDSDDRELLFEKSVAAVGTPHREELRRLRYAVLVYTAAGLFASDRDRARGQALLDDILPAVRAEAGFG